MAMSVSRPFRKDDSYIETGGAFIDGFEVQLGTISKEKAMQGKSVLMDSLQARVNEVVFKNLLFSTRG